MIVKLLTARVKRGIKDSLIFSLPKVRVKVNQGIVRGCEEKLPDGKPFQRFSGIPYAKPPINELRFRSPQKLHKFDEEEIDCTRERDPCFHKSMLMRKFIGSENCLNLNVYVPSSATSTNKLPVMLYIHGGGFAFDSNSRDFYSPEYLLMEEVIVVTTNYRFQALGFITIPSLGISGNATLKDQQLALEWVHENISNFNGDPHNICLFGESAGAAAVHLQTLNKKSSSMIKSAICQSNCALADWLFQKNGEEKTRKLAMSLGVKGNSDQDLLDALMKASTQQLCENSPKMSTAVDLRRNLPFTFKPIVERESDDAFITRTPLEILKDKNQQLNVPIMMGMNDGDGMTMGNYYRFNKLPSFNEDFVRFVPPSIDIDPDSAEAQKLAKEIKEFYFGDKHIDKTTIKPFNDYMTDYHFTIPQTMTNEIHARYQPNGKQFLYEFCYDGELNIFKKLLQMQGVPGACHFDELFYLFDAKIIGMEVARHSPAWKMRETMCKLWTNFAKYGDPTPDHCNPLSVKWNPVQNVPENADSVDLDYLRIDEKFEMFKNMEKHRIDFWRGVYKKYNSSFLDPKF